MFGLSRVLVTIIVDATCWATGDAVISPTARTNPIQRRACMNELPFVRSGEVAAINVLRTDRAGNDFSLTWPRFRSDRSNRCRQSI